MKAAAMDLNPRDGCSIFDVAAAVVELATDQIEFVSGASRRRSGLYHKPLLTRGSLATSGQGGSSLAIDVVLDAARKSAFPAVRANMISGADHSLWPAGFCSARLCRRRLAFS